MTTSAESNDFGRYLQELRRAKEIPLEAVSQVTKIRLVVLQQIENEELQALPTQTITKGFIQAYANAVGADREEALKRYDAALNAQSPKTQCDEMPLTTPKPVWRPLLLAILLITILIAFSLLLVECPEKSTAPVPPEVPKAVETPLEPSNTDATSDPVPNTNGVLEDSGEKATVALPVVKEENQGIEMPAPEEHAAALLPDTLTEDMTPDQESVPTTTSDDDREARGAEEAVPQPMAKKMVLEVTAVELTWLKITTDNADPRELMVQSDRQLTFEAQKTFQLVIGNATGLRLKLDGQPVSVPGRHGKVVTLNLP